MADGTIMQREVAAMTLPYAIGPVTYHCGCGRSDAISLPPFTAMAARVCECGTVVRLELQDQERRPCLLYTRPLPADLEEQHAEPTDGTAVCPVCGAYWSCEHQAG